MPELYKNHNKEKHRKECNQCYGDVMVERVKQLAYTKKLSGKNGYTDYVAQYIYIYIL